MTIQTILSISTFTTGYAFVKLLKKLLECEETAFAVRRQCFIISCNCDMLKIQVMLFFFLWFISM